MGASPLRDVARGIGEGDRDLDLGDRLGGLVDVSLPHADPGYFTHLLAQATKLEGVEETINGGNIRGTARQITRRHFKVHVGEQAIEATVSHHVIGMLTQRCATLSADLPGPR